MDNEKVFASGFIFKEPRDGAPEYVYGSLSLKSSEAIQFINEHTKADGWLNLTVKKSRGGKMYVELDTWTPKRAERSEDDEKAAYEPPVDSGIKYPEGEIDPADIPFS